MRAALNLTCASSTHSDTKAFSSTRLIPRLCFVKKKLFQGPPTPVRVGCSTTSGHAYDVFVSGIAMMIASNNWKPDLQALKRVEDREWLENSCFFVGVGTSPLWIPRKSD